MITYQDALDLTKDPAAISRVRGKAYKRLPDGQNQCAATLSGWLQEFEVFKPGQMYVATAGIIPKIKEFEHVIVRDIRAVQPLDIIVTLDLNRNGKPDHVGIALTRPMGDVFATVDFIDNQKSFRPHLRNLGKGGYTPMDYAIRLVWPTSHFHMVTDAQALEALGSLWSFINERDGATGASMRAFNKFRETSTLPPIKNN